MFDYSRLSSVLPCDELHINFCKYIPGANKTSTNFAILSELGNDNTSAFSLKKALAAFL
jgi:hypothetical protein